MKLVNTGIFDRLLRRGELREGCISVITLIEILRGVPAYKRREVKLALEEIYTVIPLDNEVIQEYCNLYEALKRRGIKISDADLLIAASAKAKNLTLVTADKGFERLRELGIKVEIE